MENRRKEDRSKIELAASFGIPEDSLIMNDAIIGDASKFGLSYRSKEKVKPGQEIQLALELNEKDVAVLIVRVAWQKFDDIHQEFIVGVEIQDTQSSQYQKFIDFFQKYLVEKS